MAAIAPLNPPENSYGMADPNYPPTTGNNFVTFSSSDLPPQKTSDEEPVKKAPKKHPFAKYINKRR